VTLSGARFGLPTADVTANDPELAASSALELWFNELFATSSATTHT
jgi:hypothetical protein